ncbi:MAG: hypothetical protein IKG98_11585 [Ruminococcus sp.]|nr:hypothetical protein [Ruminococcus sp.]MCR5706792.1 hypothetical protein [Ruminococcus sp.]
MTEQEMREYLESHFYASKMVKALEAEKEQLRIDAQGCEISYKDNFGGSNENITELKYTNLADEEARIDGEIRQLKKKQHEIRHLITLLDDDDLESVLIYRYIAYHTEAETAVGLNYAPRTVQEKIKKAIRKLCAKMC